MAAGIRWSCACSEHLVNRASRQGLAARRRACEGGSHLRSFSTEEQTVRQNQARRKGVWHASKLAAGVHRAHGVVASHPLRMRKALGSIPSVSIFERAAIACLCLGLPDKRGRCLAEEEPRLRREARQDTLPEWSKGVDSSSTSESCVGSNPTGVNFAGGRGKPGRSESTGLKAGEAKGGKEQKHPPWGSSPRPQG